MNNLVRYNITKKKKVKASTQVDPEPIPDIDRLIGEVTYTRFHSKSDLTKAYWQIQITKRVFYWTPFEPPIRLCV